MGDFLFTLNSVCVGWGCVTRRIGVDNPSGSPTILSYDIRDDEEYPGFRICHSAIGNSSPCATENKQLYTDKIAQDVTVLKHYYF